MSDELICDRCHLPIHKDDPIAYSGRFIKHEANRCVELLLLNLKTAITRGDNHAETLRGISRMPVEDGKRMKLWSSDGLSGSNETAEATLLIALDERNEARDRLKWRPFPEVMPPRHQHVWCLNRNGYQFEGCICYGMHAPFFTYPRGDGSASNTAPSWIDVTHWMPLPEKP